jgi:octaprenyl-diphosphate synthase
MSVSIKDVKAPISTEMAEFEKRFYEAMKTRVPLINRVMNYIVKNKGKQMRPMFVFLTAGTCGEINDKTYRGASLVELLHTATLIHDDVVDDAFERRGLLSINALWKNKIAVLVGDYLLSRGLLLSLNNEDFRLLQISSDAVRRMSEGELLQIEKSRSMDIGEETYYEIIGMKTASLIASCCSIGASSVGASEETVEKMRIFGEKIGMAFQIKDDLFDYGDDKIGKPKGTDIKERKLTLPLIHALSNVETKEQRRIKRIIEKRGNKRKGVKEIVEFVKTHGGIDYARDKMFKYQEEAFHILDELGTGVYEDSLKNLVRYTTERSK